MAKEKRILFDFMGCFIVAIFIFLISISNVDASSYTGFDFSAQLYDNLGPTLSASTTSGPTAGTGAYEGYIGYTAYSSGGAWGISSPITLLSNHTYTLTASIPNECGSLVLSTYNRIGIGTTLSNAKTSYENNTNANEVYSKVIGGNNFLIQFAFTPTINGSFIVFPYSTTSSCSSSRTILESIAIEDLGVNGATQDEINNSLSNQTNEINNSIQNSTDTIINNQNQNNEELKDTINDNFNSCRDSLNLAYSVTYDPGSIDWWTLANVNSTNIIKGKTYTVSIYLNSDNNTKAYWNNSSGVFNEKIFDVTPGNNRYSYTFTALKDATTVSVILSKSGNGDNVLISPSKLQIQEGNVATKYEEPNTEICNNKIDETNDKLDQTNDQLGDLNNSLTDSSSTDMSGLGNSAGWLPAGPVDSILTLPLTMLNSLVTNLSNNSCQTVSLELPFVNQNITLPCIKSLYDKIGITGTLFTTAGLIASAFILFNYLLSLYKWVDDTLTMRENTMPGYFDDNWGGGA